MQKVVVELGGRTEALTVLNVLSVPGLLKLEVLRLKSPQSNPWALIVDIKSGFVLSLLYTIGKTPPEKENP